MEGRVQQTSDCCDVTSNGIPITQNHVRACQREPCLAQICSKRLHYINRGLRGL